jgi:uncharacterized repeat protein (TIGR03803 family)
MTSKSLLQTCMFSLVLLLGATAALAQTVTTLLDFTGANGSGPYTGLIEDTKGNFYGATVNGGTTGAGLVFKLHKNAKGKWIETILYQFGGTPDGAFPSMQQLTMDHGDLYGTTTGGGAYGGGTVFKLAPGSPYWKETILYSFGTNNAPGGSDPEGGVAVNSKGDVYGTTSICGGSSNCLYGCGVVFELSQVKKVWTETVLHVFTGIPASSDCGVLYDGQDPANMTPVLDSEGNIYGTTHDGGYGCQGYGTVWELSASGDAWTETILHSSLDGGTDPLQWPDAGLVLDSSGNLYGTTGANYVWELVKANGYAEDILFEPTSCDADAQDYDTVTFDASGNLYWTTQSGQSSSCNGSTKGTVEKLTNEDGIWTHSIVYAFPTDPATNGDQPFAPVMIDSSGNIYGTAWTGGGASGNDDGTVFEIAQ